MTSLPVLPQNSDINFENYKAFLNANQNMTADQLYSMYPAGEFRKNIFIDWDNTLYADSMSIKFHLTDDEIDLVKSHGFVVTERVKNESFIYMLSDIFHYDLPLIITTDAILHTIHVTYDKILKNVENDILLPKLRILLQNLHDSFPLLEQKYAGYPGMMSYIHDLDFYISVPRKLLSITEKPFYTANTEIVNDFRNYVNAYDMISVNFFSSLPRKIDFSQFKPRGHYTEEEFPQLQFYFKAMMWLGRMELYLVAPVESQELPITDVQRQIIISYLLKDLIELSNTQTLVDEIEKIILTFVGDQDNVTLDHLTELQVELNYSDASEFLDTNAVKDFQQALAVKPYADQKILSQVLMKDPFMTEDLKPASAFLLFGQRFIIDSYVTGSVVYDKIKYDGADIRRMLPSTLDILFSLGNDAAAQLLEDELAEYKYSSNLAALWYLIDSNTEEFWTKSIYNNWLYSITKLNPVEERSSLPQFMQTAAWWQQKMNTQLSSWTELRHDNLLYGKQSYSGGYVCSYPYIYVEPIPEFYSAVKLLAQKTKESLSSVDISGSWITEYIDDYYDLVYSVADTLFLISVKELNGESLSESELSFLNNFLYEEGVCGRIWNGWFPKLYLEYGNEELSKNDYLVADYHTAPTDEKGIPVGWVKHAGTGPINLMIVTTELPGVGSVAFAGAVMSYHEYTSTNFLRLTDEEWKDSYINQSTRPDWVNLYLADSDGKSKGDGPSLLTGVRENPNSTAIPSTYLTAQNYPNPFNPSTIISFNIPAGLSNERVKLTVHTITGELITTLLNENIPAGNYLTKWEGKNQLNQQVASGIYFYRLKAADKQFVGKMILVR